VQPLRKPSRYDRVSARFSTLLAQLTAIDAWLVGGCVRNALLDATGS
jgi:tRNA nucleotidyltransferase/poly(A) polymerase